jgi:hypothetical protein
MVRDSQNVTNQGAINGLRPHPEERARRRGAADSNGQARVSKDEDERLYSPSCFETHRSAALWVDPLHSRRAATLLSIEGEGRGHERSRYRNPHVQRDAVHCFRIVINNESTNSGVWRLTAPLACA